MGASQHWTHRSKVWREKRVECRRDSALLPNAAAEDCPRRESCVAVGKRTKVCDSMLLLCTSMDRSDPNFGDSEKPITVMPQRKEANSTAVAFQQEGLNNTGSFCGMAAWLGREVGSGRIARYEAFGVHFHKHMFWDQHINHIINRIAKSVNILAKFWFFLLQKNKLKLTMLFFSLIWIIVSLFGGKPQQRTYRLLALRKKALPCIANADYHAHTKPLFRHFNLVPIPNLYSLEDLNTPENLLASPADLSTQMLTYHTHNIVPCQTPFSRTYMRSKWFAVLSQSY